MNRSVELRRSKTQIYVDVLRSIHFRTKNGGRLTLYSVERTAALTHNRLKKVIRDLQEASLLDEQLRVTERGYSFLSDIAGTVMPILNKYGLWQR